MTKDGKQRSRFLACPGFADAWSLLVLPALSLSKWPVEASMSKCPRFGAFEIQSPPPSNFPYFLVLFLASPKKKDEKEGRRSARSRFFRELPPGYKQELGGLQALLELPAYGDVRNDTEKPPTPPPDGHEVYREGVLNVYSLFQPKSSKPAGQIEVFTIIHGVERHCSKDTLSLQWEKDDVPNQKTNNAV